MWWSRWRRSTTAVVACARSLARAATQEGQSHQLQGVPRLRVLRATCEQGELLGSAGGLGRRFFSSKTGGSPGLGTSRIPPQAVSYGSLFVLIATGGAIAGYYKYLREEQVKEVKNLPSSGKAAVGGPWTLVGPDGKAYDSSTLHGEFSLLYFGFTFCPDICPDELEKIAEAVDLVEKITKRKIQPVFITIDPARDSTQVVNEYCEEFHPRLLGLTGTPEQIKKITRLFRVYFSKTNDTDDDYLIDHSIISYLVDPEGNFVKFFGKNSSANDMSMEIKRFVDNWKASHKRTY